MPETPVPPVFIGFDCTCIVNRGLRISPKWKNRWRGSLRFGTTPRCAREPLTGPAAAGAWHRWPNEGPGSCSPLSIFIGLALWEAAGQSLVDALLAPPSEVLVRFLSMLADGTLPSAFASSVQHMAIGFGLAVGVAIPFGIALGRSPSVATACEPVINAIYAIPPVAFVPFLIVWFGLYFEGRVALVFMMCFFEILINVQQGVRNVDRGLLEAAASFDVRGVQLYRKVVIPAALPFILTGLRVGIGRAVNAMITAELFFAAVNIGKLLKSSGNAFDTASMFGIILSVSIFRPAVSGGGTPCRAPPAAVVPARGDVSPARKWTLRFVGVGTFLVLWEIAGRILGDALFAPLSSVIVTYPELVEEYDLFRELATSLRQLAIGYVLGCVVGITVGTAMGRSRLADGLLQPWVSMLFATSIAALVPLFILLFGFGLAFRVAIVFMSTVWYVLLNTYHGARGVDPQLLETSRAFEATPLQTFRMVLLPALYPYILAGMRNGLAHAIRAMVIVEMYIHRRLRRRGLQHRTGGGDRRADRRAADHHGRRRGADRDSQGSGAADRPLVRARTTRLTGRTQQRR